MNNNQLQSLWNLMRKWNFPVKPDNQDLTCILCKKLLIEAKQAPCACKFCCVCIEEYLSSGNFTCPGNTTECKEEHLNIGENISTDHVTNRKISKLIMKCPIDGCLIEDALINIEKHVMVCTKPKIVCPYNNMGCNKIGVDKEICNHLETEMFEHSNLMSKTIENLKNEIEYLMREHNVLKEDSKRQQLSITQLNEKIDEMNNESDEQDSVESVCSSFSSPNVCESSLTNAEDKSGAFVWKIANIASMKKNHRWIDSDKFFTHKNGYTLQLRLLPVVRFARRISLYPNCVKGPTDSALKWPFKCHITLGIANELLNEFVISESRVVKYDSADNYIVKPFNFVFDFNSMVHDDCLVVKCFTKPVK